MPPAWRVYYDDGTTADSGDYSIETVPTRGVLAVVEPDERVGRIVLSGHDYYVWRDGAWYGIFDRFGLWDYLASPGCKRVLFGRTVPTDTYASVYRRAIEDDDFPRKSAWDDRRERARPPGVDLE